MACNSSTPAPGEPSVFDQLNDLSWRLEQMRAQAGLLESLALLSVVDRRNLLVEMSRDDLCEYFGLWRIAMEDAKAKTETVHKTVNAMFKSKENSLC